MYTETDRGRLGALPLVLIGKRTFYWPGWLAVRPVLLLVLALSLSAPAAGARGQQRLLTEDDIADIERFIEHTRKCHGVTAVTVSVVQGDKVVLSSGYGHADVAAGRKATAQTPFCIGSLSKAFTATLLAIQLAENTDGIDWDTPLHCYPDSDIAFGDDIRSSQVTLRDLLAHKLGVPGYFGSLLVGYPTTTTRQEIVQRIRYMEPTLAFRSGFIYNNFLYALAGYSAELLGGRESTWEQLNQAQIFDPVGMTSSGYVDKDPLPPGLALPYAYVNRTAYRLDMDLARSVAPLGPAGSVYSTADDMAKWIQLHLAVMSRVDGKEGGSGGGRSVVPFPGRIHLSDAAVRQVWNTYQPQMSEPAITQALVRPLFPIVDVQLSYAMGWMRGIYRGYRKLYHTGGIATYISLITLLPDVRAGIFLSTSGPGGRAGGMVNRLVAAYISDKLLGERPWINDSTACSFPAPWADAIPDHYREPEGGVEEGEEVGIVKEEVLPTLGPPLPADIAQELNPWTAFPGFYSHMAFGTLHVYTEGTEGTLYARYGRIGRLRLQPTTVAGFYMGHYLGKLWYLSNQDTGRMTFRLQFVHVEGGKAQELLVPIDPSRVCTFRRGLNVSVIPAHKRSSSHLYTCPGGMVSSAHQVASSFSHTFILLISLTSFLHKTVFSQT